MFAMENTVKGTYNFRRPDDVLKYIKKLPEHILPPVDKSVLLQVCQN